jgi:DNA-binding beta-propeller fold protein YncE
MLVVCTSPGPIFGQLRTTDELTKYSPNQNAAIAVGKGPNGIGVDPSGDKVYVYNSGDNTISVIDEVMNSNDR